MNNFARIEITPRESIERFVIEFWKANGQRAIQFSELVDMILEWEALKPNTEQAFAEGQKNAVAKALAICIEDGGYGHDASQVINRVMDEIAKIGGEN